MPGGRVKIREGRGYEAVQDRLRLPEGVKVLDKARYSPQAWDLKLNIPTGGIDTLPPFSDGQYLLVEDLIAGYLTNSSNAPLGVHISPEDLLAGWRLKTTLETTPEEVDAAMFLDSAYLRGGLAISTPEMSLEIPTGVTCSTFDDGAFPAQQTDGKSPKYEALEILERAFYDFPGRSHGREDDRVVVSVPKPQAVVGHLVKEARRAGESPHSITEAVAFFEGFAVRAGYRSLEEYVMLTLGYRSSTDLPVFARKHFLTDAETYFITPSLEIQEHVRRRVPQLLVSIGDAYSANESRALAIEIAKTEFHHPEWTNRLSPNDFHGHQVNGSLEYIFFFCPSEENQAELLNLSKTSIPDIFPEFEIRPEMPTEAIINRLIEFLERYRAAERLITDGDQDNIHCVASANRVVDLLTGKGFESFRVGSMRLYDSATSGDELRVAAIAHTISDNTDIPSTVVMDVLNDISGSVGMADKDLGDIEVRRIAEACTVQEQTVREVYARYIMLDLADKNALYAMFAREHYVAAVKIGTEYYLIDINGQQFGGVYDRLLLIPESEAMQNGFVLDGQAEGLYGQLSFTIYSNTFNSAYRASQTVIKRYMEILARREKK